MKLVRSPMPRRSFLYLAPFLDVALVLVAFLPLSTSFLLQPGIGVAPPVSPYLLAPVRELEVVSVTPPPRAAIYYREREVAPGELAGQLPEQKTVVIKADRDAPYRLIVEVVDAALQSNCQVILATTYQENPEHSDAENP